MTTPTILLIEDNPGDMELAKRAFKQAQIPVELIALPGGQAALDYLFGQDRSADRAARQLPSLILLDLKMPGVNGLEVLQRIRSDNRTRRVPVIVLTSSSETQDVATSYDRGANSYLHKPVDAYEFIQTVKDLSGYWLNINTAPPSGSNSDR